MFTLEIGGKPIAIIDAEEAGAREIFESDDFKTDLKEMESEGAPLWDGKAPLRIRAASAEEKAEFEEVEGEEHEDEEDDDGELIVFLVPIDALDDEEESA